MSNHRPRVKSFSGGAPKTGDHIVMTPGALLPILFGLSRGAMIDAPPADSFNERGDWL
jgi:hypothetical protein